MNRAFNSRAIFAPRHTYGGGTVRIVTALIGVVLFGLIQSLEAEAARQYRCDGRVQYRPCQGDESKDESSVGPASRGLVEQRPVQVSELRFIREGPETGGWRGVVRGDGHVFMTLELYDGGSVVERRHMGSLILDNEKTSFYFRGPIPVGFDQRWKIVATAYSPHGSVRR